MDGLHLIVHKVRGQAAIDVAQRVLIGDEDVWLIPTSGHRAYPFSYQPLGESFERMTEFANGAEWDALPDHYPEQQRKGTFAQLRSAVQLVGLSATAGLR
jgi:hypothetical protein